MFCVVALVVLSILGVFSASNRQLAGEAADCVLRRATLRPCNTGFDEKMKARILGVVITRSEGAARFLNKNFEVLAWVFMVLFLASGIFTVRGFYLFYATGSCNGANDSSFCVFDPTGENNQVSSITQGCSVAAVTGKGLTLNGVDTSSFPTLNPSAPEKIVFIGCYACDYSRQAYPEVRDLAQKYNVSFVFGEYPVKEKSDYDARAAYCVYKQDPAAFWKLSDIFFATDKANLDDVNFIQKQLAGLGIDTIRTDACLMDPQTTSAVQAQQSEMRKTGFYGTPTVFVNGEVFVGPKPSRVYAIQLRGPFFWLY